MIFIGFTVVAAPRNVNCDPGMANAVATAVALL